MNQIRQIINYKLFNKGSNKFAKKYLHRLESEWYTDRVLDYVSTKYMFDLDNIDKMCNTLEKHTFRKCKLF